MDHFFFKGGLIISLVIEGQLLPAVLWFSLSSFDLVGAWELCYTYHCGSNATFFIVRAMLHLSLWEPSVLKSYCIALH